MGFPSLSLTALFSELPIVPFSVSVAETFPAPSEQLLELYYSRYKASLCPGYPPSSSSSSSSSSMKVIWGIGEDRNLKSKDSTVKIEVIVLVKVRKKGEIHGKPPDGIEKHGRVTSRGKVEVWSVKMVKIFLDEDSAVEPDLPLLNLEPRAEEVVKAKYNLLSRRLHKDDKKDIYHHTEKVIALFLRGRVFIKKEESKGKHTEQNSSTSEFTYFFLLSPNLSVTKLLPNQKIKVTEGVKSKMDINELAARAGRLSTERGNPSSSGGRGDRPKLTTNAGRSISMLLGKMLMENKVALAKASGAARYAWGKYGEVGVQPTQAQNLFIFTLNDAIIREKIW
ncbi:unnamed protein product [Linum trigynum]|uniref:Uncharacterized protein n=1 Tax=Linum trigynum TaxID=586398 RepID=A0AAV2DTR4_9ROSI